MKVNLVTRLKIQTMMICHTSPKELNVYKVEERNNFPRRTSNIAEILEIKRRTQIKRKLCYEFKEHGHFKLEYPKFEKKNPKEKNYREKEEFHYNVGWL